jgi:hypothetical protein
MKKPPKDRIREERIRNEVIVDAYMNKEVWVTPTKGVGSHLLITNQVPEVPFKGVIVGIKEMEVKVSAGPNHVALDLADIIGLRLA